MIATEQVSISVTNENREKNRQQEWKRGLIQGAFRGGQSCLKVWTTGQPHTSFSQRQKQNWRGGGEKKQTMQWLLYEAEKGEVLWSNLSSPYESRSTVAIGRGALRQSAFTWPISNKYPP